MLDWIEDLDRQLLLIINSFHSPFFDTFMMAVSRTAIWIPLYLLIIVALVFKFRKKAVIYIAFILLLIALADQISVHLFKELVQRYRPSHNLELQNSLHLVNGYKGGLYGFVSSHSANMFALVTYLSYCFKNKLITILLFLWACLVVYSRMYLGVHYPLDILGGGILGYVLAKLMYSAQINIFKR